MLSYGELDARAGRLAGLLAGRGAGPETVVGLCLDRGADLVMALLGVWKAGAAYLPVDPDYPAARPALLLGQPCPGAGYRSGRWMTRCQAADGAAIASRRRCRRCVACAGGRGAAAGQAAYVIYTSGSTGAPKGVVVSHGGAVNLAAAQAAWLAGGAGSRVLQFASPGFDASVLSC